MSDAAASAQTPFSVVLPVFNEQDGLRAVLDELRAAMGKSGAVCEVIVVDDGSTDRTAEVLATCKDIVVVQHVQNRGYGAALKAGIKAARNAVVVIMDADGSYPAHRVADLAAGCATADMVVGARVAGVRPNALRRSVKWFFRRFAEIVSGRPIPDLNSGMRAMRRSTIERVADLLPDGFSFTTTLTVSSLMSGMKVVFDPIEYRPRIGESKFHPVRDTYRIGRQITRVGLRYSPARTLAIIGTPAVLLGAALCVLAGPHN